MGQVLQAGAGQAPARQAAIGAGLPKETPADTINKVCASSIRAIEIADSMIRAGDVDVVVTGGMESMSNAPYLLKKARFGYRLGERRADRLDGLRRAHVDLRRAAHGRAELEGRRASSASRASRRTPGPRARRSARRPRRTRAGFDDEIVAVGDVVADESIRRDTTVEKLAALKPVFDPDGTTTAGNAPGVNDGASCVDRLLRGVGREARARRRSRRSSRRATSPTTSPTWRGRRRTRRAIALERAGKTIDDVERVEINEAFASVASNSTRLLGADEAQVNVNGGAIALGPPDRRLGRPHRRRR